MVPTIQTPLDAGVDINAQTWAGWTALHYAAACDHFDCVVELLDRGADPDLRAVLTGKTPYMVACENGHAACVEALVAANCDELVVDDHYRTARQLAARPANAKLAEKRLQVLELLDKLDAQALETAEISPNDPLDSKVAGSDITTEKATSPQILPTVPAPSEEPPGTFAPSLASQDSKPPPMPSTSESSELPPSMPAPSTASDST